MRIIEFILLTLFIITTVAAFDIKNPAPRNTTTRTDGPGLLDVMKDFKIKQEKFIALQELAAKTKAHSRKVSGRYKRFSFGRRG